MVRTISAAARSWWGKQMWGTVAYLITGIPVGIVLFTIAITGLSTGLGLIPLFLMGLLILFGLTYVIRAFADIERYRARILTGVEIPRRPALSPRWQRVLQPAVWLEFSYCLALLPVAITTGSLILVLWSFSLAGLLLPGYIWALPAGGASIVDWPIWAEAISGFALGLVGILICPVVTAGLGRIQLALARGLLAPGKREILSERVDALQESRSRVMDAADAERRRIERDLHDGTQQHLVSVAMTLGLAQAKLDQGMSGPMIRELIDQAHRESKDAITELRNVIRGVYPAVLTDRGLDPALSALAARSVVPVVITVDLPKRPSPTIEAIAYFVVSECLTNIARHAQATSANVCVSQREDQLHVVVSDNGRGGARIDNSQSAGTGLAGLRDRVEAVSGALVVANGPNSGTKIEAVLPCV